MNATEIPVAQQLQCIQGSRHLIGVSWSELERGSGIVSNCLLNPPRTPSLLIMINYFSLKHLMVRLDVLKVMKLMKLK